MILISTRIKLIFTALLLITTAYGNSPQVEALSSTALTLRFPSEFSGTAQVLVANGQPGSYQATDISDGSDRVLTRDEFHVSAQLHIGPVPVQVIRFAHPDSQTETTSIRLEWDSSPEQHTSWKIPRALVPILRQMIANWASVGPQFEVAGYPGDYLIISDDSFLEAPYDTYINEFVRWKTQQGYRVHLKGLSEAGGTADAIKTTIQTVYQQTRGQLAFVLLIGDADNSHPSNVNPVPAFYYASPSTGDQNVSDHPFSIMDTDYFSDLFVGRLAADSGIELVTMLNKIIQYEKSPAAGNWLNRALVIAGNYSNTPPNPITPKWISRWIRQKFLDNGYSQVDTVYYPPTQLGQQTIADHINNGVGLVSYRGWADANGWQYPQFKISDVNSLINNAPYTPIIASIVCNTGDFANTVDPVFGEQWMRLGTPTNPKGAAGFFGPSDLHTSTKFNNSIAAGFYEGVLEEGIHNLGAAAYRGKLQLYRGFPLEQEDDEWVEFYFHVYNILGDPSTEIRTTAARDMEVSVPETLPIGATQLILNNQNSNIPNISDVYVTIMSSADTAGAYFNSSGSAALTFHPLQDSAVVTISGPDIRPLIRTITVEQAPDFLGVSDLQITGTIKPAHTIQITPEVSNPGQQGQNNVTVRLLEGTGYAITGTDQIEINTVAAGETVTSGDHIMVLIDSAYVSAIPLMLKWDLNSGTQQWSAASELSVPHTRFEIIDVSGEGNMPVVTAGGTSPLDFTVVNSGAIPTQLGIVSVSALSQTISTANGQSSLGTLAPGESQLLNSGVEITIPGDTPNGSTFTLVFTIQENDGRIYTLRKLITVGPIQDIDPVGPDAYGYFAYDNGDTGYSAAPVDEGWRNLGTNGTLQTLADDENFRISLPWDFSFYGQDFSAVTVSSNGWISFEPESISWFRNWGIPSPIGPHALIAAYWDDLDAPGSDEIEVYTGQIGDEFIISWEYCYANYDETTEEEFQIVLKHNGSATPSGDDEILIIYDQVEDVDQRNNYSTVGIESPDKRFGLQYVYATQYAPGAAMLQPGRVIKFTTSEPAGFHTDTDTEPGLPQDFQMSSNYPNPFNPSTAVQVALPRSGEINASVFSVRGVKIWERTFRNLAPGVHEILWNSSTSKIPAVSGVYWFKVRYIPDYGTIQQQTQKVLLVK